MCQSSLTLSSCSLSCARKQAAAAGDRARQEALGQQAHEAQQAHVAQLQLLQESNSAMRWVTAQLPGLRINSDQNKPAGGMSGVCCGARLHDPRQNTGKVDSRQGPGQDQIALLDTADLS